MCGIAAIFAFGDSAPPVDARSLERVCARMAVRGPDGAGIWINPDHRAALGHRRLAIIDLSSRGAQPMLSRDARLAITFNGEIYNYRELRAELEKKGCQFDTGSDTEVLLHLYAERGDAMVRALRGMFAFALWDANRNTMLLARDAFGVKPLYYSMTGGTLRVASEVKALLAGGAVDTEPEPAGHVGFFLWGSVPEPYTLYKGIRALPAGSTMTVHRSRAEEPRAFFSVAAVLRPRSPAYLDTNENVAEELRHALLDTIRAHLVADVDVGVFLSAGLDSSTQAALVAESGARLRTVTLGFSEYRGTAEDEVPLAEIVAKQYGADHRTVWITRDEFRANVDALLDRMDQPTIDGVNVFFVARAAAEAGLKVALSGIGGDELFGGYPSFTQLPRLVSLAGKIPAAGHVGRAARRVLAPFCSLVGVPKYAGILEYGRAYESAYLLRRCVFAPWELDKVLDKELAREGWAALGLPSSAESFVDGLTEPRHKVSALEASLYMRNQLLRDTDWASMSFSLEVRVPFVDPALWARVAQLGTPTTPVDKRMMASAACPALPDKVLHRPKSGFAVPIRQWLTQEDGVKEPGLRSWARYVYSRSLSCS